MKLSQRDVGNMLILGVMGIASIAILTSCSPQSKEAKRQLSQPVNCATAEGDLRVLESEKASVDQQMLQGVTAVAPAGLVMGILSGTEGEKIEVATGDYNRRIEAKIAEIKRVCGM